MENGVPAIQLRDTTPDGGLSEEPIARFRLRDVPDRYWVKPGDVLFRSRGDRNTAITLDAGFSGPAVAVMPLVILRPRQDVLPEYLAWYLNQANAQRHFDVCARGTGIRMIPMSCLSELDLPIPDLKTQRAIATVDGLARRELDLTTQLATKRQQLFTAALLRAARESIHTQTGTKAVRALRPTQGGKP